MEYFQLMKKAFQLTIHNRILWVFGLFVIGGSNLNFLHFGDLFPVNQLKVLSFWDGVMFLESHPAWLALLSLLLLVVSVVGLIVTNWSRIMLILSAHTILEKEYLDLPKEISLSRGLLWPVIRVSLFTTTFMVAVAAALLAPPLFVSGDYYRTVLQFLGVLIFLPLAFTISCINIFTTFYIVVFKQSLGKAFNLATDFFITNWTGILGLTLVLVVIYSVCFISGAALAYLLKLALGTAVGLVPSLGASEISAMMVGINLLAGLVLWVLLAGLNVFFNTVLLLLFFQLIKPVKTEEKKAEEMVVQPAGSSIGS